MEQIDALNEEINWCTASFPGAQASEKRVLLGWGKNHNPSAMFIGEAPSTVNKGPGTVFLTGPHKETFLKLVEYLDMKLDEIYVTNAIKCTFNVMQGKADLCLPFLKQEIQIVNPDFVIALGRVAMNALDMHSGINQSKDGTKKVYFGGPHPGVVRYGTSLNNFLVEFAPIRNKEWRKKRWLAKA